MKNKKIKGKLLLTIGIIITLCLTIPFSSIVALASTTPYYAVHITSGDYVYGFCDETKTSIWIEDYIGECTETLTVPAKIDGYPVKIVDAAFLVEVMENAGNIKHIIFEDGIERIEEYKSDRYTSFFRAVNLESLTLPKTLKEIGDCCFVGCRKLKTINLPESIEEIGLRAFCDCDSLTEVRIGKNVKEIGKEAFSNCQNLKGIKVDSKNKYYSNQGGLLYNKDKTILLTYPAGKTNEEYKVIYSVKDIAQYAFCGAKNLKKVTIQKPVKVIRSHTFYKCENLEQVILPDQLTRIGTSAFECTAIKSLEVPKGVKEFSTSCIGECDSLKKITIKNPACKIWYPDYSRELDKKDLTICGYENSLAQEWALKKDYKFKKIGTYNKVILLKAKDNNRTSLTLSWKKVSGADSYTVYMSKEKDSGYKKVKTTKKNKLTVKNLKAGTTYYFKVRGSNKKSNFKFSEVYETTTKPATPEIKSISSADSNVIIECKPDKNINENGYQVFISETKNGKYEKVFSQCYKKKNKVIVRKLEKGKKYYVKIRASKSCNGKAYRSSFSAPKSITVK